MALSKIDKDTLKKYSVEYFSQDKPFPYQTNYDKKELKALKKIVKEETLFKDNQKALSDKVTTFEKEHQLFIYPIKVYDFYDYISCLPILQISKESIIKTLPSDTDEQLKVDILQRNILELIASMISSNHNDEIYEKLKKIFSLILHINISSLLFIKKNDEIFIEINKRILLDKNDWNFIKCIVNSQNDSEYSDETIDEDVRRDMIETQKLKMALYEDVSFEMRLAAFCQLSKRSHSEVLQMTLRRFLIEEDMAHSIFAYQINTTAQAMGATFKNGFDHYLYRKKKTMNGFVPLEHLEEKFK